MEYNKITYTFIIPHRNTPDLLKRCVDSIPRREDIQIIIVDDNSDPQKVDFDDFPFLNDIGVEVYLTKEGKGAGYARNIGLNHAKGKWLLFADADDYFNKYALETIDIFKDSKFDIIYFNSNSVRSETLEPIATRREKDDEIIKNKDYEKIRMESHVPWAKMIRASLVFDNDIHFDETSVANDVMFSVKTGYMASSIEICDVPIYCGVIRENSLFTSKIFKSLIIRLKISCKYNRFLSNIGKSEHRMSSFYYVRKAKEFGKLRFLYSLLVYLLNEKINNIKEDIRNC